MPSDSDSAAGLGRRGHPHLLSPRSNPVSIALSRSSIRYGAVALAATAALALAGCGSSSSSSRSVAAPATTPAATSPNTTATTASLRSTSTTTTSSGRVTSSDRGFAAAIPAGFRNATKSAQGGPINILYLATGPRAARLTTNINVVRQPSAGVTDMNAIVRAELRGLRVMLPGTLRISTPERTTVGGASARVLDYLYGPATRRLHLRQVIMEHQGWIYVITYTASSTGYTASLPALARVISSWRWS